MTVAGGAITTRATALFAAAELPQCSGQVWIWVVGQETVGVLVVDELVPASGNVRLVVA